MNTCGRCGISDSTVLDLDTGSAFHPSPMTCIDLLKKKGMDHLARQYEAREDFKKAYDNLKLLVRDFIADVGRPPADLHVLKGWARNRFERAMLEFKARV